MNKIRNWGAATLATLAVPAFAALPEGVTVATGTMSTDSIALATIFLLANIGLAAFMFLKRAAR